MNEDLHDGYDAQDHYCDRAYDNYRDQQDTRSAYDEYAEAMYPCPPAQRINQTKGGQVK